MIAIELPVGRHLRPLLSRVTERDLQQHDAREWLATSMQTMHLTQPRDALEVPSAAVRTWSLATVGVAIAAALRAADGEPTLWGCVDALDASVGRLSDTFEDRVLLVSSRDGLVMAANDYVRAAQDAESLVDRLSVSAHASRDGQVVERLLDCSVMMVCIAHELAEGELLT